MPPANDPGIVAYLRPRGLLSGDWRGGIIRLALPGRKDLPFGLALAEPLDVPGRVQLESG